MLHVDLRHYHRNVWRPAVSTVVRYDRGLCPGIGFLNCLDLFLGHVNGAKYKVNRFRHLFHFIYIQDNQAFNALRHRSIHLPAPAYGLFISLSC